MTIYFGDGSNQPTGSILQIREAQLTGRNTTTSSSYVDTGLQCTMQCSSTSSRVLIIAHMILGCSQHGETFYRLSGGNSEDLLGASSGSKERCFGFMGNDWGHGAIADGWAFNGSFGVITYPNSTANLTYKVQYKGRGATAVIGGDAEDPNSAEGGRTYSQMVLIELSDGAYNS